MDNIAKKNTYFKLPIDIDEGLKRLKEKEGVDKNFAVAKALREFLEKYDLFDSPIIHNPETPSPPEQLQQYDRV